MSQFIEMFGEVEMKPFVDVCINKGEYGSNSPADDYDGNIRYVRITDITEEGNLNSLVVSPRKVEEKYMLLRDDLLFARTGNTVGKTYLHKSGRMIFAGYLIRYRLNKKLMLPQFAFAYTHTNQYYDWVEKIKKVGAQPNISAAQYDSMPIPVPSMAKQIEFVAIARQADKSKFGDFKSQFIEMFGNPLFNTKKWKWYSNINNVVTIVLGSTPNTKEPKYWDGDIKWVTPAEMDDETFMINDTLRHITEFGVKSANLTKLPIGSVLFSTRAPIGKVGIAAAEMYCNQGFKSFICSNQVDSIFLYYTLKLNKEYLCSLGTGTTFKELSKKTVEGLKLGVPPIDLQKQFAIIYKQADKSKSYVWIALKNLESMLGYYIRQVA